MFRATRVVFYLLILLAASCQKVIDSYVSETPIGYTSYYPTSVGNWVDYQVDSIRYIKSSLDPAPIISKTSYFIREQIDDTLLAFGTPYQFKVRVLYKKNMTDPWIFLKNISVQPLTDRITKNDNNLRLVKLFSPVSASTSWKGNQHIDTSINKLYGDWNYKYVDLFQPKTISNFQFDSTITVLQHLDSNAIELTNFFEIYAKNVGMIYSERHLLEKQNAENFWDKPENGYSVITKLVDWKR